ncbi:hypothetical protein K1T71_009998 [Dendrolimus kikuchii]|uniref:Uncharacterized protein n=1 Tax=Dendrolimus kikuchii TaxID=765133 RepID=A0ACC1CTY3_9NEOP|nr:hypothetical protein K1T71_009998 [Dendrolimus kikuchii]
MKCAPCQSASEAVLPCGPQPIRRAYLDKTNDCHESKKNISLKSTPFRKLRAERRAKVELEKQWTEYLRSQEELRLVRDERNERSLRLREEKL